MHNFVWQSTCQTDLLPSVFFARPALVCRGQDLQRARLGDTIEAARARLASSVLMPWTRPPLAAPPK